ncbi:sugar ABC transporter substrate-binding protein [Extibacter muris]|uniref:sugar ABC transporter substrate-binding protein n=1 Tax=Extibacter muris TaxID=1796622 RepID=UPI001D0757C1|nr:sugar ABC transporter substrate-binding protein [Extibacter muris]MCB6203236.1 sugar ABC transporter substrate-binding protein [Extibacter muris]MCQ4664832.1 sugar ABC transporter substrate-binding protein [Extibacter muris]MCQ4694841.1 sugar ABC transporter substrate-binding protein [Extibacter muris]
MKKRLVSLLLAAGLIAGLAAGCTTKEEGQAEESGGSDDKLVIGAVFADLGNTSYVSMGKKMEAKAKELDAEFMLKDTGNDSSVLVDVIENFITVGCDVIIEQNSAQEVTEDVNNRAKEAGIKIISFDSEMDLADACYLADNYELGYLIGTMAGEWANKAVQGKAEFGMMTASSYDFILDRQKGIEEGLKEVSPDSKFVIETDTVTTTDGMEAGENFLQAYPGLNGVCGINDSVVLGAYEAFKGSDRTGDDVGLFACDGTIEGLTAVAEGSIHRGTVSLHLNDVGEQMVETGVKLVKGEGIGEKIQYFPMEQVTVDNVQEFLDELK